MVDSEDITPRKLETQEHSLEIDTLSDTLQTNASIVENSSE